MDQQIAADQLQAWLVAPGKIELRRVPVPRPTGGQVLVRIECALAGGTDRKAYARGHPQIPMPGPFGHRYAGMVAALGPEAPPFALGQHVLGVHSAPCLSCELCRKERWNLCPFVMKDKVLGAFGQYLRLPEAVARQNLFPRPQTLSAEHATLLEPLACVVHGLAALDWRGVEHVLILGLGSMGVLFAQTLLAHTKAALTAAGRHDTGLRLARKLGMEVWDVREVPLAERLIASGRFDCVIECTGNLEGWQQALPATAPGGQVLLFGGIPRGTDFLIDSFRLHYEEVRVAGSFHFSPRDVAHARDLLLGGTLEVDALISGCVPLAQLTEALQRLASGEDLQYTVDPWA